MTRSRFTLLVAAILTTACGQLLDASPDGFSFGQPPNNFCTAGNANAGTSSGGRAGSGGLNSGGASAGSAGNGGAGGRAGSAGNGGGGASAGSAGNSGGSAGSIGGSAGNSGGSAGNTSAGASGQAGVAGAEAAGGQAGGAGSEQAGGAGTNQGGGAGGGPTGSPYTVITSVDFTPFVATPLTGVVGDLTVVPTGPSGFQVFARDETTHLVSTASFAKNSWDSSLWTELPLGAVDSAPAATFDGFGNVLHVFARQGGPIVNFFQPTEEGAWLQHPVDDTSTYVVSSPPAATRWVNKRPQVFAVDSTGRLLMTNVANTSTTPWIVLGESLAPSTAPAVVRDEEGQVDLFVRMDDDTLSRCHLWVGESVCLWETWPGVTLTTSPAVASWASGRLDVVVRDQASGELRYRAMENGVLVNAWTPVTPPPSVGSPSVVALGLGKLRVLVHDSDGKVFMASLKP